MFKISLQWINSLHPKQGQKSGLSRKKKKSPLILHFFLTAGSAVKELNNFNQSWGHWAKFSALIQSHCRVILRKPVNLGQWGGENTQTHSWNENGSVTRTGEDAQQHTENTIYFVVWIFHRISDGTIRLRETYLPFWFKYYLANSLLAENIVFPSYISSNSSNQI